MNATLIDGRAVATDILERTAARAAEFTARTGRKPCLATVLVGNDPASRTYVRMKVNRSAAVGLDSRRHDLPATTSTAQAVDLVHTLSTDPDIDGILVQHPMPATVDERAVFDAIAPDKDVDGVTSASLAATALSRPTFSPATPTGMLRLLDAYAVELAGRHAVVVGCSTIVGLPMGMLLLSRNTTVSYAHRRTRGLGALVATPTSSSPLPAARA